MAKICTNCHAEPKSNINSFCTACGTKLIEELGTCPKCKAYRETIYAKFCWQCGQKFNEGVKDNG